MQKYTGKSNPWFPRRYSFTLRCYGLREAFLEVKWDRGHIYLFLVKKNDMDAQTEVTSQTVLEFN